MVSVKLSEIVKEIRLERQLTQDDLERSTGIRRDYISRIERGRLDARVSTFERLCSKGFGLSLDEAVHRYRLAHGGQPTNGTRPARLKKKSRASARALRQIKKLLAQLEKEARP